MQHLPKISLIATTYNRPDALRLCIESIGRQTLVPFEVIIADDGSTDDTRTLIERMRKDFPCPIVHAWQEDLGFRAAEVRNNALRLCKGDYVVFINGDIIMHPHFVEDHAKMAQPGYYVIGSRAKFNEKATARMLAGGAVQAHWYSPGISRRMNALYLPWLGPLTVGYRKSKPLYGRSCNMAAWLTDLYAVNGFDADIQGYGYEDTDIIARLNNLGLKKKFAKFRAVEFHLHHRQKEFVEANKQIFRDNLTVTACHHGIRNLDHVE